MALEQYEQIIDVAADISNAPQNLIRLEPITAPDSPDVMHIDRSDISEDWVDSIQDIMELHRYGLEHHCIGHTYAIYAADTCIGMLLIGEGIPWACDPPELTGIPFYRIMGFIVDRRYRGHGVGSQALEMAIDAVFKEFGPRPISLGVQEDNHRAMRFYEAHGFVRNDARDEDDVYFLRYP